MIGSALGRIAMADRMSVDQLKEALQNKTLPAYIAIPLIEEKMNMQDRMRNSAAMQQPQQPPIADRVMQRAETAGIDRLPTNLAPAQGMAGGGIVAFEDGGSVQEPIRFQNQGLVPPASLFGPPSGAETSQTFRLMDEARQRDIAATEQRKREYNQRLEEIRRKIASGVPLNAQEQTLARYNNLLAPTAPSVATTSPAKPEAPKVDARLPDTAVAPPVAPAAPRTASTAPRTAAPTADAGIAAGIPPAPKAPEYTGPSATTVVKGFLEGPEGYFARNVEREKRLTDELSKNRLQGKAFDTYEQSLKKEAEQAGLDKDQAKYMAMLKAGLAMMSGTSRHALENIGKGAMVGAADYQEAYKDLRKAERERTKEFALIEQARRAEERGEIERRDNLLIRASDAARRQDEFGTQSLMSAGIKEYDAARDMWKDQYARTFDEWKTKQTIGAQERISDKQIAAQRDIAKDRLAAILARGGGRGALTANQMVQIRKEAMKNVDEAQIRSDLAKAGKLTKVPRPGEDAAFDKRVSQAYEAKLNSYIEQLLGVSGGNPFAGFSLEN